MRNLISRDQAAKSAAPLGAARRPAQRNPQPAIMPASQTDAVGLNFGQSLSRWLARARQGAQ